MRPKHYLEEASYAFEQVNENKSNLPIGLLPVSKHRYQPTI